jgi:hypothetical protein
MLVTKLARRPAKPRVQRARPLAKRAMLPGKVSAPSQARSLAPYSKSAKEWERAAKPCKRPPSPQAKP